MMHGLGKSHSLIVPAKPPNEAGAEAKEAVEERRLAKGKTLKRNRFRTQSRQILSSTLERIREGEDGSEHRYHSYSSATSALSPEARAGCGNSARPDPCGGSPARAIPTATYSNFVLCFADVSRQETGFPKPRFCANFQI
jgi:hypothetical protein